MKIKMFIVVLILAIAILSVFEPAKSFALTKGFEVISLRPATDGGPYIGVWGSKNLGQLEWELGTLGVYAYRPLQLTQNGNRISGILDNTITQHIYGQLGFVDRWLSMGFDLPVGWWADFKDPNVVGATNQNEIVIGDIYINLKSELIKTNMFGFALRPFISIPTGYGRQFFGNGTLTGGGTLIGELRPLDIWSISINAGIQGRKEFDFRDIKKDTQLELALGTAVAVSKPVSIVAEIATSTRLKDPFAEKVETPTEVRGAIKWNIGKTGLLASAGGTGGIIKGSGAPTYSVFAGLAFSPTRREKPLMTTKDVQDEINFEDYTVYFASASHDITKSKEAKKIYALSDKIRDREINIRIIGHTDSTGTPEYNEGLSKSRADKVAYFLGFLGIEPSRITTLGRGDFDPVGNNATSRGRAKNRRVEFEEIK
jgi:outer membrane protein OmpA-like peptidoglycan-associated protein